VQNVTEAKIVVRYIELDGITYDLDSQRAIVLKLLATALDSDQLDTVLSLLATALASDQLDTVLGYLATALASDQLDTVLGYLATALASDQLDTVLGDLDTAITTDLRTSTFDQILFYLQSFGSEDYTHDQAYTHGMFRNPQPANLDQHAVEQSLLDYKESLNISGAGSTTEAEVITDFEFVCKDTIKKNLIIQGPAEIALQLRIRGDGTYTTYLDKVRINLFKRTAAGADTALIANAEYDFDTAVSHSADSWDDKVGIKLHPLIAATTLLTTDKLVLRVEVFGHVSNASATDNKIRLYFSRGSSESYIYLPVYEGL